MKKTTARVLITTKCNRSCPGCANEKFIKSDNMRTMHDISQLRFYKDLIVTGGEPSLNAKAVYNFVARAWNYINGNIYMYSSTLNVSNADHMELLQAMDGITYTVHYEAKLKDIMMMVALGGYIESYKKLFKPSFTARLLLDSRLPEKFELIRINHKAWDEVKWLEWKQDGDCPLPEHEDGYYFKLF